MPQQTHIDTQAGKPTHTQPQSADLYAVNHGKGLLFVFGIERNRRLVRQPRRSRASLPGCSPHPPAQVGISAFE
jgi:hypothetical protein